MRIEEAKEQLVEMANQLGDNPLRPKSDERKRQAINTGIVAICRLQELTDLSDDDELETYEGQSQDCLAGKEW